MATTGRTPWWRSPVVALPVLFLVGLGLAAILFGRGSDDDQPDVPGEELDCSLGSKGADVDCEAIGNLSDDVVLAVGDGSNGPAPGDLEFEVLDPAGPSVIRWTDDAVPAVGDVIVTTVGEDDRAFYGRVTVVNDPRVETEPATLMDVFDDLALEVEIAEEAGAVVEDAAGAEFGPEDDLPDPGPRDEFSDVDAIETIPLDDEQGQPAEDGLDDDAEVAPTPDGGEGAATGSDGGASRAGGPQIVLASQATGRTTATPALRAAGAAAGLPCDLALDAGTSGGANFSAGCGPLSCTTDAQAAVDIRAYPDLARTRLTGEWTLFEGVKRFEFAYLPSVRMALTAGLTGKASCTATAPLFAPRLPNLYGSIGPVPIFATQTFTIEAASTLEAEASVNVSVDVLAQAALGVRLESGRLAPFAGASLRVVGEPSSTVAAELTGRFGLPITYEVALYGVFGAGPTIEPFVEATVAPAADEWFTLAGGVDASVKFFAEIPVVGLRSSFTFGPETFAFEPPYTLTRDRPPDPPGATTTTTPAGPDDRPADPTGDPELVAARQRWESNGGRPYRLFYEAETPDRSGTYCVSGVAGSPSQVVNDPSLASPPCEGTAAPTLGVQSLFDIAGQVVADGSGTVAYNQFGAPEFIEFVDAEGRSHRYTIVLFEFRG